MNFPSDKGIKSNIFALYDLFPEKLITSLGISVLLCYCGQKNRFYKTFRYSLMDGVEFSDFFDLLGIPLMVWGEIFRSLKKS